MLYLINTLISFFYSDKYSVTILERNWMVLKSNVSLISLPRISEYIYLNDKYYQVINVVHDLTKNNKRLVIVDEVTAPEIKKIII